MGNWKWEIKWNKKILAANNYIHAFFSKDAKAKSKEQNKGLFTWRLGTSAGWGNPPIRGQK